MNQMKQLKSTSQDLRDLFEHNIFVKHVAEDLQACEAHEDAVTVRNQMKERDFDVFGIKENGIINGYIEQAELKTGLCKEYEHRFLPSELIAGSASLLDLLTILRDKSRIFVSEPDRVTGIVTRGDLQKAPFRMLLFGLVSLLEMQLLRVIQSHYPADSWQDLLKKERLDKTKELLAERQRRNESIGLADCLQFCDKREIVMNSPKILQAFCFESNNRAERFLKEAEKLRDKLAHSQDIVTGSTWPKLLVLVTDIQRVLEILETM